MTQLTDKVREAIIGNVGTVISGRVGITDAELLVKKFAPAFEAEDLAKIPNHQSITSVMINNVPSAPFSMSWIAPMGDENPQLNGALKRLSAAKYGRPRAQVEKEIFDRLGAAEKEKKERLEELRKRSGAGAPGVPPAFSSGAPGAKLPGGSGSSFLDDWLAKRQQLGGAKSPATGSPTLPTSTPVSPSSSMAPPMAAAPPTSSEPILPMPDSKPVAPSISSSIPSTSTPADAIAKSKDVEQKQPSDRLHVRGGEQDDDEVTLKLR